MCLICVELTKNKLTSLEARRSHNEMRKTRKKEHMHGSLSLIYKKEDEEYESMWATGSD